ncbi:hypothetical protein [Streptomyces aureus]|uniref:hypothetical protein n=1 Tax=Streptomyces aureus TaxID=193461 RepID=UPI00340DA244
MPKPYDVHDAPPTYQSLVQQWGPPLGIEEARKRWSELVTAAGKGTITLIARTVPGQGQQWTALVPLSAVADPVGDCPVWPLLAARKRLGQLVDDAAWWPMGRTQLLSRRHTLVAALVPAAPLADRDGERIDIEELLRDGGTVTLGFYAGAHAIIDSEGEVIEPPEDEGFIVTATTHDGTDLGVGNGPTIAEALIRLARRPRTWAVGAYSTEPPF